MIRWSLFACAAGVALAQSTPRPEFEVASIKPAAPITNLARKVRIGMHVDAGRMEYLFGSLRDCIRTAYHLKDYQIQGPDWLADTRFDIVAKLPEGATIEQVPEMLQALLAARFHLELHRDSKEHSVYALVPGKNGPKLTASTQDAADPKPRAAVLAGDKPAAAGGISISTGPNGAQMQAKQMTLPGLADMLSRFVDRPVIDMTGVDGEYDFSLDVAMDQLMQMKGGLRAGGGDGGKAAAESAATAEIGATIFQSIQKYGLKLEPRKAQVETLVVDRVEKSPTEN